MFIQTAEQFWRSFNLIVFFNDSDLVCNILLIIGCLIASWLTVWLIRRSRRQERPLPGSKFLLIVAHPDDEAMFFGPMITSEIDRGSDVYVLCLSDGNFYGVGSLRAEELRQSCEQLGVPRRNVYLAKFQDDPNVVWNIEEMMLIIKQLAVRLAVDTIVSFDDRGVSGHLNHIAIHDALQLIADDDRTGRRRYVCLESVNILRKYCSLIDDLVSLRCVAKFYYRLNFSQWQRPQAAMRKHSSQFVWFRRLYIKLSRYMTVNSFKEIFDDH